MNLPIENTTQSSIIKNSKYFDSKWYQSFYHDIKGEPSVHYLNIGWKKGYNPSPDFDTNKYLDNYPDVKKNQVNPLYHYECFGKNEGRQAFSVTEFNYSYKKINLLDKFNCILKNKSPKISFILINNQKQFFKESLDSLVNQTYKNLEIIILNQTSNQKLESTIKEYSNKFKFINFSECKKSNEYDISNLFHAALLMSSGDYIAFCNTGDLLSKDYLKEKVNVLNKYAYPTIILNNFKLIDNTSTILLKNFKKTIFSKKINLLLDNELIRANLFSLLSSLMIKKQSVINYCQSNTNLEEAFFIFKNIIEKDEDLFFLNQSLTNLRLHEISNNVNLSINSDDFINLKFTNEDLADAKIIKNSKFFDSKWYSEFNKIDDEFKNNPEIHYLKIGWKNGLNPSKSFNQNYYLSFNEDVKAQKINPLLHYEKFGKNEGRNAITYTNKTIDILILSMVSKNDGCFIWRAQNFQELFRNNGLSVEIETLANPSEDILTNFYAAKTIFFQRPFYTDESIKYIKEIIKYNKKLIIDIDDLLFENYVELFGGYKSLFDNYPDLSFLVNLSSDLYNFSDLMSVSTPYLSDVARKQTNKENIIIRNVISPKYCNLKTKLTSKNFKLIFTSGSMSHDFDTSTIFLDLFNFMNMHEDVTLTIVGKSSLEVSLQMFKNRIQHVSYVEFDNLFELYSQHDLLIVPLEYNLFNKAKSNIKYIEAGAVGTPVIAQDCDEFKDVIKDGVNGFLYHDNFFEKLEKVYNHKENLYEIGKNAHQEIIKNHTTNTKLSKEIMDVLC